MESRTVQIGDIVQITVQGQNYNIPITLIDAQGIHTSDYVIVSHNNTWQVENYPLPHTVAFFPVTIPSPSFVPTNSEEPPVYAVYSRTGPRKIFMLLKPRTREVIYTPLGITFLNLNQNKLPSYELATNFIARDQQFVLLSYIKGRAEQEIEQLISLQQPPQEYDIKDLIPGEIYSGQYGYTEPVERNLRSLIPYQNYHSKYITQVPKDMELYNTIIKEEKTFYMFSGMVMFRKDRNYIIVSDANFTEILNDIKKCGKVYYLISSKKVTSKDVNISSMNPDSHAMAIVIDPQINLLEVFDPNGITPDTRHVYFWVTQLISYLKENGIEVYRKITADEPFCPQGVSAFASEFRGEQQCLVWSYWYIWLRINNPTVPAEAIRRYMVRMTPEEAFDRVRRIATIAFSL
jgi:hypothetical protein